jgi:choline dehydrogenase-like flavoprotein
MVYTDNVPPFVQACNTLGIPTNANPHGGHTLGVYDVRKCVDFETGKRVDAAEAYYVPASSRKNLKVVTGAHVMFYRYPALSFAHTSTFPHRLPK